jgi:hypothetical protein
VLQRLDAVAQPGGLLVAEVVGQPGELRAEARERSAVEDRVDLFRGRERERTGRE